MTFVSFFTRIIERVRPFVVRPDRYRLTVYVMVVLALVVGLIVASLYQNHAEHAYNDAMLTALWRSYKTHDWDGTTGRTVDPENGGVTTSEAQGYTMLRAVWSGDRATFDTTWHWTLTNLERPDHLFSWRYGKRPDGTIGILANEGGENTASDADIDIATALLMASATWHDGHYKTSATRIVSAIWEQEVLESNGRLYLAADNLEKHSQFSTFVMNPSYVSPYAFRLFSRIDQKHNWAKLTDDSYVFLRRAGGERVGGLKGVGLPPDWLNVDRRTGRLLPPTGSGQTTDFGYNAFRALWRVGLDWQWFHPSAAQQELGSQSFLNDTWHADHKLAAIYRRDGHLSVQYESLAQYGGDLGSFDATDRDMADEVVRSKLQPLYDPSRNRLQTPLSYYDNNWVWFGLALHEDKLPNLFVDGGTQ